MTRQPTAALRGRAAASALAVAILAVTALPPAEAAARPDAGRTTSTAVHRAAERPRRAASQPQSAAESHAASESPWTRPRVVHDVAFVLLALLVDVAVTVFLIERLQSRREERRWAPARNLLNAELFKLADEVVWEITPPVEVAGGPARVRFGDIVVVPKATALGEGVSATLDPQDPTANAARVLATAQRVHTRVRACVGHTPSLVDPSVTRASLEFDGALERLSRLFPRLPGRWGADERREWLLAISELLAAAAALRAAAVDVAS